MTYPILTKRLFTILALALFAPRIFAADITIDAANVLKASSPWIYGACIEDVNHEIYGGLYDQRLYGESFEEPVGSPQIIGWSTFDGSWTPAGESISVAPNNGAKIVQAQPVFLDGTMEFDLRFSGTTSSSINGGAIVRVQNAGRGADAFDGYEISLASDGKSIVLGRHQQNFASLQTASVNVVPTDWQHLRVVLAGSSIKVYLNGAASPSIDFNDPSPLPAGSVGLRTWGASVEFRNVVSVTGGQQTSSIFAAASSYAVSGMWDGVVTGSAVSSFSLDTNQPYNGTKTQRMQFVSGTGTVGVANRGLNRWGVAVKNGKTYSGRVYLRGSVAGNVTVTLQSLDGSQIYALQTLSGVTASWTKFPLSLAAIGTDANARFVITLDAPGTLWIDQAVLQDPPTGQFQGLTVREDIANAMKAQGLSFLRYGGTAVNVPGYRWKQMVGDPDLRSPYVGNWYPYTTNGWAIEEFLAFCERAGIQAAFAINAEETPQDMADMVEYLNGPASSPWGSVRAANGHPKPYGVKYIQIGNEEVIWGDIAADYDHYIERFKLLATAMKAVDPNLVFINAAWWRGNNPNCRRVLEQLEGIADYWDFHVWADDANAGQQVDATLAEARQLFQQWVPGSKTKIVIFEENGNTHNLQRALGHAGVINAVRRYSDFVFIDCAANGLQPWLQNDNGWNQGQVFFTPDQVWGMPPFYANQMASENHLPLLVSSQTTSGPQLDVAVTKSFDGKSLCISIVNFANSVNSTRFRLNNFANINPTAKVLTLSGNFADTNSPTAPTKIQPVAATIVNAASTFLYNLPARSYTVIRITSLPVAGDTPGETSKDLFVDTFNRADSVFVGGAWLEGYEEIGAEGAVQIFRNALQLASGGGVSEVGLNRNFVEPAITSAGGFSVSMKILGIDGQAGDLADRYVGFGVGLNASQTASGNTPYVRNAADCFVELDANANVKVWMRGVLKATAPAGASTGTLAAAFSTAGFGTSDTVNVGVYFNGRKLNLGVLSFQWDEADANRLALSARAVNLARVDNFAVRTLPISDALAVDYAVEMGLSGASSNPGANSDTDRVDNRGEWAFGTDPTKSDDNISGPSLTATDLAQGFQFSHRRLGNSADYGVSYLYEVSEDLQNWHSVAPTELSFTPLGSGYDSATFKLPDSEILGKDRLFLRILPKY